MNPEKLFKIFDTARKHDCSIFISCRKNGTISHINNSYSRLTNLPATEVIDKHITSIFLDKIRKFEDPREMAEEIRRSDCRLKIKNTEGKKEYFYFQNFGINTHIETYMMADSGFILHIMSFKNFNEYNYFSMSDDIFLIIDRNGITRGSCLDIYSKLQAGELNHCGEDFSKILIGANGNTVKRYLNNICYYENYSRLEYESYFKDEIPISDRSFLFKIKPGSNFSFSGNELTTLDKRLPFTYIPLKKDIDLSQKDYIISFKVKKISSPYFFKVYFCGSGNYQPDRSGYSAGINPSEDGGFLQTEIKKYARIKIIEEKDITLPDEFIFRVEKYGNFFRTSANGITLIEYADTSLISSDNLTKHGLILDGSVAVSEFSIKSALPPPGRPSFCYNEDCRLTFKPTAIFRASIYPAIYRSEKHFLITLKEITKVRELEREKERFFDSQQRELSLAKKIHNKLIPSQLDSLSGIKSAFFFLTCDKIGGDIFDTYRKNDDIVYFYIYDISGHGVSSAMLSPALNIFFKEAFTKTDSPAEILGLVNESFCNNFNFEGTGKFFTAAVLKINTSLGELTMARGGHCYPILMNRETGSTKELRTKGSIMGVFPENTFSEKTIEYRKGSRIFLFTDGVFEFKEKEQGKIWGTNNLYSCFRDSRSCGIKEAVFFVRTKIEQNQKSKQFEDDMTLIGIDLP